MGQLLLIEGPAGSGKSQVAKAKLASGEYQVLADLTEIWAAIAGIERDPETGRYPVRLDSDPTVPIAVYLRKAAVSVSLNNGLNTIVSSGTPGHGR